MKKTVITILLVLPFVLMFVISFMAKIISNYQYVYVDRVCFINDENVCYSDLIKLEVGETKDLNVKVFPELASNKTVSYSSLDTEIVSIDKDGKITALDMGTTKVFVKTQDGNKSAELLVKVSNDYVSSVDIEEEEITINEKQSYSLTARISPYTAIDKSVVWTTSDPNVATVDRNGKVIGVSEGVAIITVTTNDGGFTDECVVTVLTFDEAFDLVAYDPGKSIYTINTNYFDLNNLVIIYDDSLDINSLHYYLVFNEDNEGGDGNSENVYIENNYLTIIENILVEIEVSVDGIDYKPTIRIQYKK